MKGLETGKDKVKKICEVLRKETLEPAKHEADEIVEHARRLAAEMIADAKGEAEKIVESSRKEVERQKTIFQASLSQACRQTIESLKEQIEKKLFSPELSHLISKPMQEPKVIAKLIEAVIQALGKEGISADLSVFIPAAVPAREITELLSAKILARLSEKGVLLSPIGGGIEVKLVKENLTLDLSDAAIKELLANYIRKDFRDLLFGSV